VDYSDDNQQFTFVFASMTPAQIVGEWLHENVVTMGPGIMRIRSVWVFTADGAATLSVKSDVEHGGQVVSSTATKNAGLWTIDGEKLLVDLPDHQDSPFKLSLTETGELSARKRGSWRRMAQ
jgi:hypothetical protein